MSIYVIRPNDESTFFKIGFTKHVEPEKTQKYLYRRYKTSYGDRMSIMYIHAYSSIPEARNIEKRIFILLAKYQKGVEVFDTSYEIIDEVLKSVDGRQIDDYKQKYMDEIVKNIKFHHEKYKENLKIYTELTGEKYNIIPLNELQESSGNSFNIIKEIMDQFFEEEDDSTNKELEITTSDPNGILKYLHKLTKLKKNIETKISVIHADYVKFCKNLDITDTKSKIAMGMLLSSKIKLDSYKKKGTSWYKLDREKIKEYLKDK